MTTETMMTEAATTTEGATASEQAEQQSATGAEAAGQQQATEGQEAGGQEAGSTKAEGEHKEKPEGAPEKYEFATPDGVELDGAVVGAFSEIAKELNLPQEQAQKVIDKVAPVLAERQAEQLVELGNTWAEAARSDKEFGGDKLTENMAVAKKGYDMLATPELRDLLEKSRLGNHPEIIRVFYRAGKAISEDRFVSGNGASSAAPDARRLYAASNMNP